MEKDLENVKELTDEFVPETVKQKEDKELFLWCIDNMQDMLTRSNEQFHFTATAFIVNKSHDKVLCVYHNIYDSWSLVGGHCDGMKILQNVVSKEIKEETSLKQFVFLNNEKPISLEKLLVDQHFKNDKLVFEHYHLNFTFLVEADDTLPLVIKTDENSDIKWFKFQDFLEGCTEKQMLPIYQFLVKKVKKIVKNSKK